MAGLLKKQRNRARDRARARVDGERISVCSIGINWLIWIKRGRFHLISIASTMFESWHIVSIIGRFLLLSVYHRTFSPSFVSPPFPDLENGATPNIQLVLIGHLLSRVARGFFSVISLDLVLPHVAFGTSRIELFGIFITL